MEFRKGQDRNDPGTVADEYRIDVTDRARAVFGDIAQSAEQVVDNAHSPCTLSEDRARYRAHRIQTEAADQLNLAHGDVIITFVNGAVVRISSSEWGHVIREAA
jgi:hypothetical protein